MKICCLKFLIPVAALAITSCTNGKKKENSETGFVQIDDVTMVCSDLKSSYAPSKGAVKMLVVPISFVDTAREGGDDSFIEWTDERITNMEDYYFGESDSLATYYATASLNSLQISGKVTDIYENSTISVDEINNDGTLEKLFDMIEDAINWVHDNDDTINWAEYDLNQDGCIDSVHLITDYKATEWNTSLWPHMYWTGRTGTVERPLANVYSISGTAYVIDAITAIHEQGHIFGLEDYYDYSGVADYVGGFDMQSHNVFDWNSFSKLSMGWVKPYVVNGEADVTTINIKAASINGDCILIPADYSTWNGSAFDEYFLLELFAPYGNNKRDWAKYASSLGKKPGIRVYHVDGRTYGSNKVDSEKSQLLVIDDMENQAINSKEDVAQWSYITKGANNSSNWRDYEGGVEQLGDHPLLSLVQKGGEFTFAQTGQRHTLNATDLFKVGNEFTFEKYSKFLNKSAEDQLFMNNGEEFPYTFTIDYIDDDSATVTITKVK